MSMIPNTNVSPAASRNSISPNCRPFSDCSKIRIQDMKKRAAKNKIGVRPRFFPRCALLDGSLHIAFLDIGVAVVLEDGADGLVDEAPLAVLRHHAQVVVLDRHLVPVELERAAHRLEARRLHRLPHCVDALDLALDVAPRGVYYHHPTAAVRCAYRLDALVSL